MICNKHLHMCIVNANAKQKLMVVTWWKYLARFHTQKPTTWWLRSYREPFTVCPRNAQQRHHSQSWVSRGSVTGFQVLCLATSKWVPQKWQQQFFFTSLSLFQHFRKPLLKHSNFWKWDLCDVKRCTDTSCRLVTIHPPCVCPDVVHPWDCLVYVPSTCKEEFYRKLTEC